MLLIQLVRAVRRVRSHSVTGIILLLGLLLLCVMGNALTFLAFESSLHDELTFADALWYSVVSITTIGYGDFYAQTTGGRIGTILFVVILGLSIFTALFGMLVDLAASFLLSGHRGLRTAMANDHTLIVNFPSANRVLQVVEELIADPGTPNEIVIVSNDITELPFARAGVLFVRGQIHAEDTFRRAHADRARMAIVLSRDYGDPNSDAINAAAAGVIDRLNPNIHIVAECVDLVHRDLFSAVRCNAIVAGLSIASNLLVQEAQDPGVSRLIEVVTSNREGETLYTTRVESTGSQSYKELVRRLLDDGINVLGVCQDTKVTTRFGDELPQEGDRIMYLTDRRRSWAELTKSD